MGPAVWAHGWAVGSESVGEGRGCAACPSVPGDLQAHQGNLYRVLRLALLLWGTARPLFCHHPATPGALRLKRVCIVPPPPCHCCCAPGAGGLLQGRRAPRAALCCLTRVVAAAASRQAGGGTAQRRRHAGPQAAPAHAHRRPPGGRRLHCRRCGDGPAAPVLPLRHSRHRDPAPGKGCACRGVRELRLWEGSRGLGPGPPRSRSGPAAARQLDGRLAAAAGRSW